MSRLRAAFEEENAFLFALLGLCCPLCLLRLLCLCWLCDLNAGR